jgi:hypothetical protein
MTGNQVVSTIFDIESYIRMARIVSFQDRDEDLGLGIHFIMCFSQAAMEFI